MRKFSALLALSLLAITLAGCATPPSDPAERREFDATNDPLEPTNRSIFDFNQFVDRIFFKPAAKTYRTVLTDFVQEGIHNVLANSEEPVRFMNTVLQGRVSDAGTVVGRFLVNTTVGLAGIIDVASDHGLPPVYADLGQTFHDWGIGSGPYLVLPFLGPSNPRDAVGFIGDSFASPWGYVAGIRPDATATKYEISDISATLLDRRSEALDATDALEKGSVDYYAELRSVSRQYRAKQLGDSTPITRANFDDVDDGVRGPKPGAVIKAKPGAPKTSGTLAQPTGIQ